MKTFKSYSGIKIKVDSTQRRSMKDTTVNIPLSGDEKNGKELVNGCLWRIMLLFGVFIYGSYTVLVHLCEKDGKIPFSSSSMVLITEIMKIVISVTLFSIDSWKTGFQVPSFWFCIPFAVPAILYFINNNIAVHMQLQMDPTTYQVLSNLKIATTALLYRLIIKRPITSIQWISLGLLTVAGVFDSYGGFQAKGGKTAGEIHISIKGLFMIVLYCFISGLSGVYTEYILKQNSQSSLHLQNILLYSFGIVLNFGMWTIQASNHYEEKDSFSLFKGYSIYTWIIIITQAVNGLIMSAVMKHASNITRLFIISCAMLITTVLSILIFNLQLNIYFGCAFICVIIALALYHT
ncbi:UDP-sugar transporter SLC35A4 [Octopus vulgaris]|uniref:UDP-sugar transporter SLC35A4 n=1 Tax=Octopus vulgaris TaxID=6645 RepID=A0AA36BC67_OCTVU|nr:UDP-sugar transporter SLC35A4 [Octopus vulgaris]